MTSLSPTVPVGYAHRPNHNHKEGKTMPRYMLQLEGGPEIVAGMIKNPTNRAEAVAPIFESVGGTLEQYYFDVGGTGGYLIVDMPTRESLSAVTLSLYSSGALKSMKAIALMTATEAVEVFKMAGEIAYTPPSA